MKTREIDITRRGIRCLGQYMLIMGAYPLEKLSGLPEHNFLNKPLGPIQIIRQTRIFYSDNTQVSMIPMCLMLCQALRLNLDELRTNRIRLPYHQILSLIMAMPNRQKAHPGNQPHHLKSHAQRVC